mmetsp:Transcript_36965/g.62871  ORF Transcript_36965/g.62871 Transcript_36965/m.62871 type:complete len:241 (+) Transcript_36965:445-1167(+)
MLTLRRPLLPRLLLPLSSLLSLRPSPVNGRLVLQWRPWHGLCAFPGPRLALSASIIACVSTFLLLSLLFLFVLHGLKHCLAQRTRGTPFRQPRKDTVGMKRVLARQDADLLPQLVLIEADGTGIVIKVRIGFLAGEEVLAQSSAGRVDSLLIVNSVEARVSLELPLLLLRLLIPISITIVIIILVRQIRHLRLIPQLQIIRTFFSLRIIQIRSAIFHRGKRLHLLQCQQTQSVPPPSVPS